MKTIAIVGAGPLLGMAIARKFGRNGFRVALIARTADALERRAAELRQQGIEAVAFPADITDAEQLVAAFSKIKQAFGVVDVLEFSPTDWGKGTDKLSSPSEVTAAAAQSDFDLLVLGAVRSVQQVLPDMKAQKSGALLFTTGYSAIKPLAFITSLGIANSGLRNYAYCLNDELAAEGIYAGTVSINAHIVEGTDGDPAKIAEVYFDMYTRRDRVETVFSA